VVIVSVPLLFAIERDLIALNKGKERYIPFLVNEAKRLEKSDVDFIVMPCNSLHVFIDEIRNSVNIPVLGIVEATINYLINKCRILAPRLTKIHNHNKQDQRNQKQKN
jgi:aspartate/glutamate racemase